MNNKILEKYSDKNIYVGYHNNTHDYELFEISIDDLITDFSPDVQREKEFLMLCKKVLDVSPSVHYNGNGFDTSTCPFCWKHLNYPEADINEIEHSPDCAYLIAKDLSTGLL